jgi:hypothetical protein
MTYIVHPDLPGQRADVPSVAAWVRSGWVKDPDQKPPPVVAAEDEPEADVESADKPAEQPARRTQKEQQ